MNWFTGIVLFVVIWWTALFAVLPIGTRPVQKADETSGWRGAPEQPRIGTKSYRYHTANVFALVRCVCVDLKRLHQFPARRFRRAG